MKKIIVLLSILFSIIVFCNVNVCAEEGSEWTLKITDIEGERASCTVYPYENENFFISVDIPKTESDKLLFPLRFVAENLGAKVQWKAETGDIMFDFGAEQWVIYQPEEYKNWGMFLCENTLAFAYTDDELFKGALWGYSDISGDLDPYFYGIALELIDNRYYMEINGLKSMAEKFRSTVSVDEENRIVEVFITPKPFYCDNIFEKTTIKVDNGNGDIQEISALKDGSEIKAISIDGFMSAIGGKSGKIPDKYIEEDKEHYTDGYCSRYYRAYEYKEQMFIFSCRKDSYYFDDHARGNFDYTVWNASKDTEGYLYYISQESKYYEWIRNGSRSGLGCMIDNSIYSFTKNYAKNLVRFFGYEFLEDNGEYIIKKVSDDFDESFYFIMYR